MIRSSFPLLLILALCGCSPEPTTADDDAASVLREMVATLTADRRPVCIDSATSGDSLSAFRTMLSAPQKLRQMMIWRESGPLRAPASTSGWDILGGEFHSDKVLIAKPTQQGAPLSFVLQRQLNFAAARLASVGGTRSIPVASGAATPLAKVRWWALNRLTPGCSPAYTIANPSVAKNLAFVSVKAGHWGTTYAFAKQSGQWKQLGQWSGWLY